MIHEPLLRKVNIYFSYYFQELALKNNLFYFHLVENLLLTNG